jgi:hypothetical protein
VQLVAIIGEQATATVEVIRRDFAHGMLVEIGRTRHRQKVSVEVKRVVHYSRFSAPVRHTGHAECVTRIRVVTDNPLERMCDAV